MNVVKLNFVPAMLAIILLFVTVNTGEQVRKWWGAYTPAIVWHGVEVITKSVSTGGELIMIYNATVNKQCPADIHGFIVTPDNTVAVRYPVLSGGYSKPSDGPIRIPVKVIIPAQSDSGLARLKSGPHLYRTLVIRYCADGVDQDSDVPDAPFNLEVQP